jgi:signal transduction histidine kinase
MPARSETSTATSSNLTLRLLTLHVVAVGAALLLAVGPFLLTSDPSIHAAGVASGLLVSVLLVLISLPAVLRPSNRIRRQLAAFPADPEVVWDPQPVNGRTSVEAGWNRLVAAARNWHLLTQLERQIGESLDGAAGNVHSRALDALKEGVAVTDADNLLLAVNSAFASLCVCEHECDQNSFKGRLIDDCLPDDVDLAQFRAVSRPVSIDVDQLVDGEIRHMQIARRPRLNEAGQIDGHVWTLRDMTQQHLAEEAREQFVASATHELRTPLASIRAYAETLATSENIDREQQKRFFNTIQSEASRLSRFIDDLLDVSRMQAGSLSLDCHETDIERLISETVEKIRPAMDQKQQAFEIELPSKLPHLNVDKGKISAALVNLLGNASKYTPDGGRISFRVATSGQMLEFAVADSGIGIAPEELSQVFERFFRSDDDRVHEVSGSGLGLTLTQEIARLHGGDVLADSQLNKGSTFRLVLPISTGV